MKKKPTKKKVVKKAAKKKTPAKKIVAKAAPKRTKWSTPEPVTPRVGDKIQFTYLRVKSGNPVRGIVREVGHKLLTIRLQKQVEGFSSTWKRGEVAILEWKHVTNLSIKKKFTRATSLKTKLSPEEYERIKGSAEAELYTYNKKTEMYEQALRLIQGLAKARRSAPQFCLYTIVGGTTLFLKPDGTLTENKKLAKEFYHGFDSAESRIAFWEDKLGIKFKHRYHEHQDLPVVESTKRKRKQSGDSEPVRANGIGDGVPVLSESQRIFAELESEVNTQLQ
jgi:hypothetical protein